MNRNNKSRKVNHEHAGFINIEWMRNRYAKAKCNKSRTNVLRALNKYLSTKCIYEETITQLIEQGYLILQEALELIPSEQALLSYKLKEVNKTIANIKANLDLYGLSTEVINSFRNLIKEYHDLSDELGTCFATQHGDISHLFTIYLLVLEEYVNLNQESEDDI